MTYDEYSQEITNIHIQLERIANRTHNQAWVGLADPSNPEFIALMQKHAQLTKLSSELTERMVNLMKTPS